MQNPSPLKTSSMIENPTLTNPDYARVENPFSIIRKFILTQQFEQENSIQKNLLPVFFFIKNNDLENLEKLIIEYPEILKHQNNYLTPIFYAIEHNNLEALQLIIKICPEILNQKIEDDITPIFYAIENNNLEALK